MTYPTPTDYGDAEEYDAEPLCTSTNQSTGSVPAATASTREPTPSSSSYSSPRASTPHRSRAELARRGLSRSTTAKRSYRWQDDAACKDHGVFFYVPEYPLTDAAKLRITRAKAVCTGCPVRQACLSFAHRNHMSGVWGGVLIAPLGYKS